MLEVSALAGQESAAAGGRPSAARNNLRHYRFLLRSPEARNASARFRSNATAGTWHGQPETGIFTGVKPEFGDLAVHEDNGVVKGSFYARFRLPSGKKADPTVRFDFSGPATAERVQRFPLQTCYRCQKATSN